MNKLTEERDYSVAQLPMESTPRVGYCSDICRVMRMNLRERDMKLMISLNTQTNVQITATAVMDLQPNDLTH